MQAGQATTRSRRENTAVTGTRIGSVASRCAADAASRAQTS